MIPKVKICCISSLEEAQMAIDAGASILGLVGKMPSGPGIIKDSLIAKIAKFTPKNIETFLLTSETTTKTIIAHYNKVKTTSIQIVDAITDGTYLEIRKELPHVKIIQVIHVLDDSSINEAIEISHLVDSLLLDSGNPTLQIKTLGGTGNIHNWKLSKKIVKKVNIPVFLAGGLNPQNVKEAIHKVNPYGLDLCSGVRTNEMLDSLKLKAFFENIKLKTP